MPDPGADTAAAPPLAIAVIGSSGHAARVAAPTIEAAPGARLAGVLGSTPERARALSERHGCGVYRELRELCEDGSLAAVWIAGPNDRHAEHAVSCLRAGKHVLLEKPMATSASDANELAALATRSALTLTVGFQHRFRPAHAWIRAALADGFLGRPYLLRVHRFWPFPYFAEMPADPALSWRSSLEGSGGWVLNDIGAHLIDLALWLLDTPAQLAYARTSNLRFHEASAEDTALLVLDTEIGATVTVETSNATASFPGTIEIHGADGWIRADGTFDDGGMVLTHRGRREFGRVSGEQVASAELDDFLAAIRGERAVGASPEQAALTVAIVEQAVRGHAPARGRARVSGGGR
jgi:UDP-N-acetyl-2-amino-2-deoxyglucuronate dehydrogenase